MALLRLEKKEERKVKEKRKKKKVTGSQRQHITSGFM